MLCVVPVGGRVAEDHQRFELGQRLPASFCLPSSVVIQNQDGAVAADHIDRLARLEIVQLVIDAAVILSRGIERLDIDDHDVDARIGREAFQMGQLLGVVGKEADLFAVALGEMLGGDFKRFEHSLTDGNAGHHHDELGPAVPLVHLEDGFCHSSMSCQSRFPSPRQD